MMSRAGHAGSASGGQRRHARAAGRRAAPSTTVSSRCEQLCSARCRAAGGLAGVKPWHRTGEALRTEV